MGLSPRHQAFLETSNEETRRMPTIFNLFEYGLMIVWYAAMCELETVVANPTIQRTSDNRVAVNIGK